MWMAAGNAYSLVCAPVEGLGEHSCKPCAEEAGPEPALQKRPYCRSRSKFYIEKIS